VEHVIGRRKHPARVHRHYIRISYIGIKRGNDGREKEKKSFFFHMYRNEKKE
jgi:hypothetical protein